MSQHMHTLEEYMNYAIQVKKTTACY